MKRKTWIIGIVAVIIAAFTIKGIVYAQMPIEKKVTHITEKMSKKLDLSQEQKEKVYQINLKRANGHQAAYNAGRNKELIKEAVKNWENELKTVLNTEQIKEINFKTVE
jgi:hypothetical protein